MTTTETSNNATRPAGTTPAGTAYAEAARNHLWMHFTRESTYEPKESGGGGASVPIIVKGEGAYIWDDKGRKYLDALAGLFVVQVGHGRKAPRRSAVMPPTASPRRSSSRAPTPWPPSSSSRCRTRAAVSRRRPGTCLLYPSDAAD